MKLLLLLYLLLFSLLSFSQRRTEIFDYSFQPVKDGGYYFVQTEKADSLYKRQAWFLSQKTLYMEGWYRDETCKVEHGPFTWYHVTRYPKETGNFTNGLRDGAWLRYNEDGVLTDSVVYQDGHKKGIGLSWYPNGYLSDSTNFDGAGNGVEVSWFDDGSPASAGFWAQDTLKRGRWKYYHRNGAILATEDYDNEGKLTNCLCYNEQGVPLDTALCREKEAIVDKKAWKRFLENGLQPLVEQKAREGIYGSFTVAIRFLVDKEGKVTDVKALTAYGHGIEEGVVAIFKKAPVWSPGRQHGRLVRSYHTQPVSFVIATN